MHDTRLDMRDVRLDMHHTRLGVHHTRLGVHDTRLGVHHTRLGYLTRSHDEAVAGFLTAAFTGARGRCCCTTLLLGQPLSFVRPESARARFVLAGGDPEPTLLR